MAVRQLQTLADITDAPYNPRGGRTPGWRNPMSSIEPKGPYVYQPYGAISDPEYSGVGRLWGVSGVSLLTTIKGLTQEEAQAVAKVLAATKAVQCLNPDPPP